MTEEEWTPNKAWEIAGKELDNLHHFLVGLVDPAYPWSSVVWAHRAMEKMPWAVPSTWFSPIHPIVPSGWKMPPND